MGVGIIILSENCCRRNERIEASALQSGKQCWASQSVISGGGEGRRVGGRRKSKGRKKRNSSGGQQAGLGVPVVPGPRSPEGHSSSLVSLGSALVPSQQTHIGPPPCGYWLCGQGLSTLASH